MAVSLRNCLRRLVIASRWAAQWRKDIALKILNIADCRQRASEMGISAHMLTRLEHTRRMDAKVLRKLTNWILLRKRKGWDHVPISTYCQIAVVRNRRWR